MVPHVRTETGETLIGTSTFSEPPSSANSNDIIPPKHLYRTLVLCFDGTGDQFDADNSNIVELFRLLKKDDSSQQMVYYQAGIGTYTSPDIATPFMAKVEKAMDEAIAWNLHAHVMSGYEFVMQNYRAGDRICIFGFSRGAYTARSLAGMIHKVGVLPAGNFQQVPFAYSMYAKEDEEGWRQSNGFKRAFSIDVDIEFIGVWDTVSSVGIIPKRLPFTTSNTIVRTFRHAVSLDEHRAKFKANLWQRSKEEELGTASAVATKATYVHPVSNSVESVAAAKRKLTLNTLETLYDSYDSTVERPVRPTDVEEVWFAGCHCDVGGGSVSNDTKPNLARIPLRWMIRECFRTNSGIMFHSELLKHVGLDPDALYPEVKPRPPALPVGQNHIQRVPKTSLSSQVKNDSVVPAQHQSEEEMDLADALSPIYDQLSLAWGWWILEFWPIQLWSHAKNSWFSWLKWGWNLGRGRIIPKQTEPVKVHRSVKQRLDARYDNNSRYVPKASGFEEKNTIWVD